MFIVHLQKDSPMAAGAQQNQLEQLIQLLSRLPGLGPRSARRALLHLVNNKEKLMIPLAHALNNALEAILVCDNCGNIDTSSPCQICQSPVRATGKLCIVESVSDLWALERAKAIEGRFHVLGGVLSPLDGVGPDDLRIDSLMQRLEPEGIQEVIIAVNATVEGQTTAHYLADLLETKGIEITRLAHGVPVGGELDYLDEGTLSAAMRQRRPM